MYNQKLEQDINLLNNLSMPELKEIWLSYFSEPSYHFNRDAIIRRLAYRMQELEYGGLSSKTKRKLIKLAENKNKPKRINRGYKPVVGTRLIREFKGVEHCVTVLTNGFEYEGRHYKSLSSIATHIAGVRWSGNAFFGLNSHLRKQD